MPFYFTLVPFFRLKNTNKERANILLRLGESTYAWAKQLRVNRLSGETTCYFSFKAGPDVTEGDTAQLYLASVNLKMEKK